MHRNQRVKPLQLTIGQGARIRYWGNYLISKSGFNVALTVVKREALALLMMERLKAEQELRLHRGVSLKSSGMRSHVQVVEVFSYAR
jgi:hypothetical protein